MEAASVTASLPLSLLALSAVASKIADSMDEAQTLLAAEALALRVVREGGSGGTQAATSRILLHTPCQIIGSDSRTRLADPVSQAAAFDTQLSERTLEGTKGVCLK